MDGNPKNIKAETNARAPRPARKKITETYLHNAGLHYLQRFAASTAQFRKVMERKIALSCRDHPDQDPAACAAMLDALVTKLSTLGLLNDGDYTRGMVNSLRRRGLSERAILMKLNERGIAGEQIRAALAAFNADNGKSAGDSELDAALSLARRKKLGPYARVEEAPTDKALAAFARAGFSYALAQRVLTMTADDLVNDGLDA